jgi:hypothetical protein
MSLWGRSGNYGAIFIAENFNPIFLLTEILKLFKIKIIIKFQQKINSNFNPKNTIISEPPLPSKKHKKLAVEQ